MLILVQNIQNNETIDVDNGFKINNVHTSSGIDGLLFRIMKEILKIPQSLRP